MSNEWNPLGKVSHIWRYPLKGVAGEEVASSKVGWHGLTNDRRFALLRIGDMSGLPWASPRQFPQLLSWTASIPAASTDLRITTPSDEWLLDPKDVQARSEFADHVTKVLGEPMMLVQMWSGAFDSMPISVVTTATIQAAAELVGAGDLDMRRFRSNITIETDSSDSWPERQWLGRELRLGSDSAILRIDRHITRCEVVDLQPGSGKDSGLDLFKAIKESNRNRAGVYATPRHVGQINVGATVWIR